MSAAALPLPAGGERAGVRGRHGGGNEPCFSLGQCSDRRPHPGARHRAVSRRRPRRGGAVGARHRANLRGHRVSRRRRVTASRRSCQPASSLSQPSSSPGPRRKSSFTRSATSTSATCRSAARPCGIRRSTRTPGRISARASTSPATAAPTTLTSSAKSALIGLNRWPADMPRIPRRDDSVLRCDAGDDDAAGAGLRDGARPARGLLRRGLRRAELHDPADPLPAAAPRPRKTTSSASRRIPTTTSSPSWRSPPCRAGGAHRRVTPPMLGDRLREPWRRRDCRRKPGRTPGRRTSAHSRGRLGAEVLGGAGPFDRRPDHGDLAFRGP